jgi:hypothetical protein
MLRPDKDVEAGRAKMLSMMLLVAALALQDPAPAASPEPPAPPPAAPLPDKADWARQLSAEEMLSAIRGSPAEENMNRGVTMEAMLDCVLGPGGIVKSCRVENETPTGCGMGEAALKIAPYLRFTTTTRQGHPSEGTSLRIPLVLSGFPVDKIEPLPGCPATP